MIAPARRAQAATNILWLATFVVSVSGYALGFRLLEGRIDERAVEIARSADQLRADGRVQASAPQLAGERERLRRELARVSMTGERSRLVARFVYDAARITARLHTKITAISGAAPVPFDPVSAPSPLPPMRSRDETIIGSASLHAATITADPFESIPLEVVIEGRYVNLLAALRELSATRVPAHVELGSLARKNVDAPDATLTASLHVTLERLAQPQSRSATPLATRNDQP